MTVTSSTPSAYVGVIAEWMQTRMGFVMMLTSALILKRATTPALQMNRAFSRMLSAFVEERVQVMGMPMAFAMTWTPALGIWTSVESAMVQVRRSW